MNTNQGNIYLTGEQLANLADNIMNYNQYRNWQTDYNNLQRLRNIQPGYYDIENMPRNINLYDIFTRYNTAKQNLNNNINSSIPSIISFAKNILRIDDTRGPQIHNTGFSG